MPAPTYAPEIAATRRAELVALTVAYIRAGVPSAEKAVGQAVRTQAEIDRVEAGQ